MSGVGTPGPVLAEVGHLQIAQQQAAVGAGICAHAPVARRASSGGETAVRVEEFFGPVAPQPVFQHLEVFGIHRRVGDRHLMGAEGALDQPAVDDLRPGPTLR